MRQMQGAGSLLKRQEHVTLAQQQQQQQQQEQQHQHGRGMNCILRLPDARHRSLCGGEAGVCASWADGDAVLQAGQGRAVTRWLRQIGGDVSAVQTRSLPLPACYSHRHYVLSSRR